MRLTDRLALAPLGLLLGTALAHSPHDDIDAIVTSPAFEDDRVMFAIAGDHLKRSTDGGLSWKELVNGLDNLYPLGALGISGRFRDDRTVFVTAGPDGVYRSVDAGDSWERVSEGLGDAAVVSIAVDPDFSITGGVFVIDTLGRVYRSDNHGSGWRLVPPLSTPVTALTFGDPKVPEVVVAGDEGGGIWLSEDGGGAWQALAQLPEDAGEVTALAVTGRLSGGAVIVAGTGSGRVYRQAGQTQPFVELAGLQRVRDSRETASNPRHWNSDHRAVTGLAISPRYAADGTLFATTWNEAVFRSTDRGRTWERLSRGLSTDAQANTATYLSPQFRQIHLPTTFGADGTAFVAGFDGLFMSTDAGEQWIQVETLPVRLIKGLAVAPMPGAKTAVALSTYGGGGYVSMDGGARWTIATEGLRTTRLDGVGFSPAFSRDRTIFAAANRALLRTENAGVSWVPHEPGYSWRIGLSRRLGNWGLGQLGRFILEPEERGAPPYPTDVAVSPDYPSDRTVFFATRRDGVWVTRSGGENAVPVLDTARVTSRSLAISPGFARDGTVFAALRGGAVYKSADHGATWSPVARVVPEGYVEDFGLDDGDFTLEVRLTISPDFEHDATLYAFGRFGLSRSTDGGASWRAMELTARTRNPHVTRVALSPDYARDETMLVATRAAGLSISRDGGASWRPVFPGLLRANHQIEYGALSPHFALDQSAYLASEEALFEASLARETWREVVRPVRYENHRDMLRYAGEWEGVWAANAFQEHVSRQPGASVSLDFVGTGIVWRGTHGPSGGRARVLIDGKERGIVSQRALRRVGLQPTFEIYDLAQGAHRITVEVIHEIDDAAGGEVSVDAFDTHGAIMTVRGSP